jgi:hypothetical protein
LVAPASEGAATTASPSLPSIVASPSGLIAFGEWTFDDLRMGPIENEPNVVAEGGVQVVALPTAINRSIGLPPDARFCIDPNGVLAREGTMSADLHLAGDLSPSAEFFVTLTVAAHETYQHRLRVTELRPPSDDDWVQLQVGWSELPAIGVNATVRGNWASVFRDSTNAERLSEPSDAALCFLHVGSPDGGEILIDNVRLAG